VSPSVDTVLQFFTYEHLPPGLQHVSQQFHDLAQRVVRELPDNRERTMALRKLLEAKDCAVRAVLYKDD
jgi:ferritin-like protein